MLFTLILKFVPWILIDVRYQMNKIQSTVKMQPFPQHCHTLSFDRQVATSAIVAVYVGLPPGTRHLLNPAATSAQPITRVICQKFAHCYTCVYRKELLLQDLVFHRMQNKQFDTFAKPRGMNYRRNATYRGQQLMQIATIMCSLCSRSYNFTAALRHNFIAVLH